MSRASRILLALLAVSLVWWGGWSLIPDQGPAPLRGDAEDTLDETSLPSVCEIVPTVVQDVSRLNPAVVSVVCRPRGGADWTRSEDEIRASLRYANSEGLTVSIAAQRHSQGGHISAPGGLLLDLNDYRGVRLGAKARGERRVRALSGTTWAEVQVEANGDGLHRAAYEKAMANRDKRGRLRPASSLAVAVQQSSNVFSIGGSLSANCHGRDKSFGPILTTVRSFRIMLHDGRVVRAARDADEGSEGARLFRTAIGGFGLLGVILDVELDLRDNVMVDKRVTQIDYRDYVSTLKAKVLPDPAVQLHYGRLNIDELDSSNYLREMYYVDFRTTAQIDQWEPLATEHHPGLRGAFMEFGEGSSLAKKLRWKALLSHVDVPGSTVRMTLNNAMRPKVQFLFERHGKRSINILQEYFVPLDGFASFIEGMRTVALKSKINFQNVTLRFVAGDDNAMLSYAPTDRIAVVLYINVGLQKARLKAAEGWTRDLVALTLAHRGRYYLAYQRWPTRAQLDKTYPRITEFLAEKRHFDPGPLFVNQFFNHYFDADQAP